MGKEGGRRVMGEEESEIAPPPPSSLLAGPPAGGGGGTTRVAGDAGARAGRAARATRWDDAGAKSSTSVKFADKIGDLDFYKKKLDQHRRKWVAIN
jgi:hypothetical protein